MHQIDYYTAFKDINVGDLFSINGQGPFRKLNATQFIQVVTINTLTEEQTSMTVAVLHSGVDDTSKD
jgi:hypothetical protein